MRKYFLVLTLYCGVALSENLPTQLLVGFSVNGKEIQNIDAIKTDAGYAMPYDLFIQSIGIQPTEKGGDLLFDTPIGKAQLHKRQLISYKGTKYIPLPDLKALGIAAKFQPSTYAVELHFPWDKNSSATEASRKKDKAKEDKGIDYYPQFFGANELSISGGWSQEKDDYGSSRQQQLTIGSSGSAAGGVWGAKLMYNQNSHTSSKTEIDNAYWATAGKHTALRVGINQPSYDVGNSSQFTGAIFAYSTQSIDRHLKSSDSHSEQLLQDSDQDYRTISGRDGPAGGVAELRINGRGIARVRVALDKRYEFKNLEVSQLRENKHQVEIALYEYESAGKPLKVIPYHLGRRQANVATGELLLEAGIGRLGNQFNKETRSDNSDNNYHYAYGEYGLTNHIALRLGTSQSTERATVMGANIVLHQSLNWDVSALEYRDEKRYRSELAYERNKLALDYHYEYLQTDAGAKEHKHSLSGNFRPSERWNFYVNAEHNEYNDKPDEDYFSASVSAQLTPHLSARLSRDSDDEYSYGIDWDLSAWNSDINLSGDNDSNDISIGYSISEDTDIGLDVTKYYREYPTFRRLYAKHQFNEDNQFFASYSRRGSQSGFQLDWQYKVNKGIDVHVGYRKNNLTADISDDDDNTKSNTDDSTGFYSEAGRGDSHYAYIGFEMNLSNTSSGWYFSPYNSGGNGRILADITTDGIPLNDSDIILKLDRHRVKAERLADGKYLIDNIKPGVYQLRLDDRNLPIEYSANDLPKPMVKVANAANTVVPYHLTKSLGVSGKIENYNSNESNEVLVEVYQGDKKITEAWSNVFGYYQISGLKPATYQIKAKGYQTATVVLKETYLFEVNLRRVQ